MNHSLSARTILTCTLLLAAGCHPADEGDTGSEGSDGPTVLSSTPQEGDIAVAINRTINVRFSEPLDPASVTADTFTLQADGAPVPGEASFVGDTATFTPTENLAASTRFDAEVTPGMTDVDGNPLETAYTWSFTTGETITNPAGVDLGGAGDFAILAKTGISTVPSAAITGDLGVSPSAATFITGFSLTADPSNVFSTSPQVTGKVYAADYAVPTPTDLTAAVGDMELAFTDAAGRAPDVTELGAGNIGGMTLAPGVYKWGTGLFIPTDVTLTGRPTDKWIFQIAQDLTVAGGTDVVLAGGALPQNVVWQVAGLVDLGTTAHVAGVILSQTSITLRTGASVDGRLLAQAAVDIDASTIVAPAR